MLTNLPPLTEVYFQKHLSHLEPKLGVNSVIKLADSVWGQKLRCDY